MRVVLFFLSSLRSRQQVSASGNVVLQPRAGSRKLCLEIVVGNACLALHDARARVESGARMREFRLPPRVNPVPRLSDVGLFVERVGAECARILPSDVSLASTFSPPSPPEELNMLSSV